MKIEEHIVKTYEADPEALKEEFPNEYREFLREGGMTDKAWIQDCIEDAGLDLFALIGESHDVEII